MKVYVLLRNNGACGDPECCGSNEDNPCGVTTSLQKAKDNKDGYEEFELDES